MALSDKNKRAYSAEEIAILEGVIDYADRMIYEDQNLDALGGFADTRGYVSHSSYQKEAPRLCRGGSRSLTFQEVVHRRDFQS